jgi:hypothetical protein
LSFTGDVTNVDAAVLQPLLEDVVDGLEGRLDGNFRLALVPVRARTARCRGPATSAARRRSTTARSSSPGSACGFRRCASRRKRRKSVAAPWFRYASFPPLRGSKNPNVSASADLYLDGLVFEGGRANVNVRGVPLMIQGSPQATLTGTASVELERRPDRVYALVKVPKNGGGAAAQFG